MACEPAGLAGNGCAPAEASEPRVLAAADAEAEADDQLMSLPEECDAHLSQRSWLQEDNGQDMPATGALPAATSQFSRLDPSRRSFSSPTVNYLAQQHMLAGQSRRSGVKQATGGSARSGPAPDGGRKQKPRRRTALGLISLGSAHFRAGSAPSSAGQPHAQLASPRQSAGWRTWFTIGGSLSNSTGQANKQARKFLLRNLRPKAATTVRGE